MAVNIIDFRRGTIDLIAHGVLVTRPLERRVTPALGSHYAPRLRPGESLWIRDDEFFIAMGDPEGPQ
jgi:hypothetical protein